MPTPPMMSNPFSATRLRPGTIEFVFEHGRNLAQLVDLLEANHWLGEITGRHGTGKSTLLAALTPAIEARGRTVNAITLSAGQRNLPHGYLASLRSARARAWRSLMALSNSTPGVGWG